MEVSPPEPTPKNRHFARPYVGLPVEINSNDFEAFSRIQNTTHIVKPKTPRKSKVTGGVDERERNGTCDSDPPSPLSTAKLPKRMRLDLPDTNGIIPSPRKSPTKPRKERIPKTPPSAEKPKRKYTKRKIVEQHLNFHSDDQIQMPPNFNSQFFSPPRALSPNQSSFGDNQWARSPLSSGMDHSHSYNDSSFRSRLHGYITPTRQLKRNSDEACEINETRLPNNNTHLLLSPQTLKRMLRSPSPASSQNANATLSDDDLDEEIMLASNSLFKDMSLRRGEETGSPSQRSYASSTSTTSSCPQGRGRYSRRKFGRLYPSFDPNHCLHPHCLEGTLTGSKYCNGHAKGHVPQPSSSLYAQCIYTDPFTLKPCKKTVYGEDEGEFKFCEFHSERVTSTRMRMHRKETIFIDDDSVDSLMEELADCVIDDEMEFPSSSPATVGDDAQETVPSYTPVLPVPERDGKEKDELREYFWGYDRKLLEHQYKNVQLLSKFQPDQDSDEEILQSGDDPLKHSGYYSTDEVIANYRSRLDKLRSAYKSHFSGLRDAYMDCRQRFVEESEENDLEKFSFTTDPKFINMRKNQKLMDKYKEEEMDDRERSLRLMRYRHRCGAKKVILFQAMKENDKQAVLRENERSSHAASGHFIENPYDLNQSLIRVKAVKLEKGVAIDFGDKNFSAAYTGRTCAFIEDTSACSNQPLPLAKYCKSHIIKDQDQKLFSLCESALTDPTDHCTNTILRILEKPGCCLHSLAEVTETKPSEEEILEMNTAFPELPFAELEEEQDVLEELVANEIFNVTHFDRAVKYLEAKGYELPDTDESEGGEDDEEDEAFKNLLLEELKTKLPMPKRPHKPGKRRSGPKRKKEELFEDDEDPRDIFNPPFEVPSSDTVDVTVPPTTVLPTALSDEEMEPQPTLVLLSTD